VKPVTERSAYPIRVGDQVFDSAGGNLGRVVAVEPDHIVVEQGRFFPTDYAIPVSAIDSSEAGRVSLNVAKDDALDRGWATTTGQIARTADSRSGMTMRADALRMPVYEEALTVTKIARELAGTRIDKIVATEEQRLDAPLVEERLKVVRRAVYPVSGAASGEVFEEVLIDVPLEFAPADLTKPGRVSEEIAIWKEVVQRTERVSGTVLREQVRVIDPAEEAQFGEQEGAL
jgi:uncharacterized protein (TIGR02271 family)